MISETVSLLKLRESSRQNPLAKETAGQALDVVRPTNVWVEKLGFLKETKMANREAGHDLLWLNFEQH